MLGFEGYVPFEVGGVFERFLHGGCAFYRFFPSLFSHGADDEIFVADDFGRLFGEFNRQLLLQQVLVRDDQFAARTISTRFTQDQKLFRVHVDQERELPQLGRPVALRAPGEPDTLVRIQVEPIPRRQFSYVSVRHQTIMGLANVFVKGENESLAGRVVSVFRVHPPH